MIPEAHRPKWLGRRTTMADLERRAWDNGRLIEFDHELNLAVLKVSGQTWYAEFDIAQETANTVAMFDVLLAWADGDDAA